MKNILLLTLSLFLLSHASQAQDTHFFKGRVYAHEKKLKGTEVKVYRGKKAISTYTTKRNGKFLFFPLAEAKYILEFSKPGYLTKRIMVNTENTRGLEKDPATYRFDITLKKDKAQNRAEYRDFPVAIIQYHPEKNEFGKSLRYQASLRENNNDLANK
ncbi:MAG: hypothetical protein RIC95_13225 [Vicingaceae bacterium]